MAQDAASFVVSRFAATAKVFTPPTILLLGRPPDTQSSWRWLRESESSKTLVVTQRILLGILTREWGYSYTPKSWDWGVNHPKWLFQRDFQRYLNMFSEQSASPVCQQDYIGNINWVQAGNTRPGVFGRRTRAFRSICLQHPGLMVVVKSNCDKNAWRWHHSCYDILSVIDFLSCSRKILFVSVNTA